MCHSLDLNVVPAGLCPTCREPLTLEFERDANLCADCQCDESLFGSINHELHRIELLTPRQIDELAGVTHRRRAS